ncbi:hypothetical protein AKO1_010401 [Acrasis kona]|uniref:Gamma-interferon-inducible lysosomal thiol reductase n=1 Tax=Acrasis kona TaxID=1008807 RepID=A0AAW2YY79_9EUKA
MGTLGLLSPRSFAWRSNLGPEQKEVAHFHHELLNKVKSCVTGDKINAIMHKNAQETAQLQPPHKYVPWLVIDGQHVEDYGDDLLGYICARYKGTKPAGCRGSNRANVCLNE